MSQYYPPKYKDDKFHCPYCNVYAAQVWRPISQIGRHESICINQETLECSSCLHCGNPTFWLEEIIIYPPVRTAPLSNSDLPDSVKAVYDEAASIANQSPRAASALLRLAIEMLLKHLGETGSINDAIKNLVAKGLDPKIQQSLDIVRVTGNNAVHAGKIDFDDTTNVQALFELINVIADALITHPKRIQQLYNNLPEDARKAVEKRDGQTQ